MINRTALVIAAATTAFTLVFAALLIYAVPTAAEALSASVAASGRQGVPQRATPETNSGSGGTTLLPNQAAAIALQAFPRARLLQTPEPVTYLGVSAYEVRLSVGVVYVDEATGQIINQGARTARSGRGESEGREGNEHGTLFGFRGERHED